ncbi:hypothetical protein C2G38_2112804 [Gigaspora rosea]|uniref:Uncharacterized protein n=1 Tax=Gigaspora rosea TaxID=44941 RepID=A0A397UC19_9GLOM|nr:hypothetical protein C2G38_2112804 [Gigaspora rosea]
MGFLRGKFQEEVDWKASALNSISLLKDKIKDEVTPVHEHLFTRLSNTDVNKLSKDDPLCIGIIDLSSNKYIIPENNFKSLVGKKADIKNLDKDATVKHVCHNFISKRNEVQKLRKFVLSSRETVTHNQWVEADHVRGHIASGITDVLLQEIKLNALQRVSGGSENTLVEIISRLLDMTIYHLPVDFDVEVTRSERQSIASKNWKIQQKTGSRGNKPDIMIRACFRQKWEEIIFFECGKWGADEDKILHDHNKLTQFCLAGSKELVKKCLKENFYKNYIGFAVNIAGKYLKIHGLIKEKGVKYYLPIIKAKIPLDEETTEEVEEFVHALLVLRNGLIVNLWGIVNSQKRTKK